MKITGLETVLLSAEPSEPIRWSGGELRTVHAALVVVHTDEGITGLGESYAGIFAPKAVRGIVEALEPLLLGEDPTDVTRLYNKMYTKTLFWARVGVGISTIGAIETALWDILGKVRQEPVWKLLGGAIHDRLPLYASGGLEKPLEETVEEMKGYKRDGLHAVKVRIGMDFARDLKKVAAVRETLGNEIDLMVDAVQGHNPEPWTSAEAIRIGKAMEPFKLRWFEEPCAATDYDGYARVRNAVNISISGGESSTSIFEFRNFFEAGALDIAQPDTAHSGGIQECRKIAALAQNYGAEIAFHSWGSSVVIAPNYHLAFTTPNTSILEYPTWGYPLRDELFTQPLDIRDGYLYPPQAPGLGVELTTEIRQKYAFKETAGVHMRRAAR